VKYSKGMADYGAALHFVGCLLPGFFVVISLYASLPNTSYNHVQFRSHKPETRSFYFTYRLLKSRNA